MPRIRHPLLIALLALPLGACAISPAPPGDEDGRHDLIRAVSALGGEVATTATGDRSGLVLGVHSIPTIGLEPDEDGGEPGHGVEIDADWRSGTGRALEIGARSGIAGFGLLYLESEQYERYTRSSTDLWGLLVEVRAHTEVPTNLGELSLTAAAGVGYAKVSYDGPHSATQGTAVDLRGAIGLRFARSLGLELGIGLVEWGKPGETIGQGTFATAGLTWHPR